MTARILHNAMQQEKIKRLSDTPRFEFRLKVERHGLEEFFNRPTIAIKLSNLNRGSNRWQAEMRMAISLSPSRLIQFHHNASQFCRCLFTQFNGLLKDFPVPAGLDGM